MRSYIRFNYPFLIELTNHEENVMKGMKLSQLLLCIFLIGEGLISILGFKFDGIHFVMGSIALAAGVLPFLDK